MYKEQQAARAADAMTGQDDRKTGSGPARRRPARRPATIDLAASEVSETGGADANAAGEDAGAPESAGSPASTTAGIAGDADAPHERPAAGAKAKAGRGRAEAGERPPAGASLASVALAAVAGGLIALGAYAGLAGLGLAPGGADTAAIGRQIDDINRTLVRLEASAPAADPALAGEIRHLTDRLDAFGDDLDAVRRVADAASPAGDLAALAARLDSVEAAAGELRSALGALAERGDGAAAPAAALVELGRRMAALETDAAALRADLAARTAAIETELGTLRDGMSALAAAAREAAAQEPDARRAAALAIAVAGLERAVQSGGAFVRELALVERLDGPAGALAALRPHAATGIARLDQLAGRFDAAASAAFAASRGAAAGGIVERFFANARSIVRVRPTGEAEGETTGAILARAEARLGAGDLAGAVAELSELDAAAGAAMAAWLAAANARLAADRALAALTDRLAGDAPASGGGAAQ